MGTIKTNYLMNVAETKTVPTDTIVAGTAKAWVNFNGSGTVAIRDSFNVTSITDNGTGDYTVNFTTAFSTSNYALVGTSTDTTGSVGGVVIYSQSTSSARIYTIFSSKYDSTITNVAVFSN